MKRVEPTSFKVAGDEKGTYGQKTRSGERIWRDLG